PKSLHDGGSLRWGLFMMGAPPPYPRPFPRIASRCSGRGPQGFQRLQPDPRIASRCSGRGPRLPLRIRPYPASLAMLRAAPQVLLGESVVETASLPIVVKSKTRSYRRELFRDELGFVDEGGVERGVSVRRRSRALSVAVDLVVLGRSHHHRLGQPRGVPRAAPR